MEATLTAIIQNHLVHHNFAVAYNFLTQRGLLRQFLVPVLDV